MKYMRVYLHVLTCFLLFNCLFTYRSIEASIGLKVVGAFGVSIAGVVGLYHIFKQPGTFEPTVSQLNTLTMTASENEKDMRSLIDVSALVKSIHDGKVPKSVLILANDEDNKKLGKKNKVIVVEKGIVIDKEKHDSIFLFSRGYAKTNKPGANDDFLQKGGCVIAAYWPIRDNIINKSPCITFDYPDSRRLFNFGQETDLTCLREVYKQTLKVHKNAKIILIGDCRGAKAALAYAAEKPKNLHALVLMSPFISSYELTQQVAKNYLSWLPGSTTILDRFFRFYFPNYDHRQENLIEVIATIDPELPILIGHRAGDKLVDDQHIVNLVDRLQQTGHKNVHVVVVKDNSFPHARLTFVKQFVQGVNTFLQKYDLPHHHVLANQGKELFADSFYEYFQRC